MATSDSFTPATAGIETAGLMQDLDALTQQHCGEIDALVTAALGMLELKASALVVVRQLLLLIRDRAQDLSDEINSTAEGQGCNYIDDEERAFVAKMQQSNRMLAADNLLQRSAA